MVERVSFSAALCHRKMARDRQPEAGAAALLATEGKAQAVSVFTRDPPPVIGDVDDTRPAGTLDFDADPGDTGMRGVTGEIEQDP